jgi:hypothetical protein
LLEVAVEGLPGISLWLVLAMVGCIVGCMVGCMLMFYGFG